MQQTDPKSSSRGEHYTDQITENPHPHQFEYDTIDLYEIWIILWKKKWLIIAVTVVATLVSVVYALTLPRIYKAEARLLPPKDKDVQLLNVLGIRNLSEKNINLNENAIPASAVFSKFKQNISSRNLHKKFIQEKGLMELLAPERTAETRDEYIYQEFAELIKLEDVNGVSSLSIELHDAEIAAQWVNDLIRFIDKETIAMLVEDLQTVIANEIREIEYTIASKRQMAKERREDRITQYQEAASIARELGVMDRVDSTNIVQNNQLNITTSNIPLYFRGFKALNTEITYLKTRQSDDPFISELRDLQERLTLLRSIKFDKEKISAIYIDQAAYPPKNPIKPNRRLIVSLATVVGLFSGIFLTFLIEFVQNQRKKHSE